MRRGRGLLRIRFAALAGLVLVSGCASDPPGQADAAAPCGDVTSEADQGHHHLVGDRDPPIEYNSVPPTSGWHYRGQDRVQALLGVNDEPLTEPEHVSVLAVDGVVVSYHDLDEGDRSRLEELLRDGYADRVALTPYGELEPGQVAMTAWRTRQVCDGLDEAAITAFIDDHAADEPDFDMGGEQDH